MLDTGVADYIVNRGIDLTGETFNQFIILRGISNVEIGRIFKNIYNADSNENLLVFSL